MGKVATKERQRRVSEGLKLSWRERKLGGSKTSPKSPTMAGRKREREPDPSTPQGQWALWFRTKLPADFDADKFAETIGKDRSSVFNYLGGDSIPPVSHWPKIAKALRLPGWWSLCPTEEFILGLPGRKRRK